MKVLLKGYYRKVPKIVKIIVLFLFSRTDKEYNEYLSRDHP